MRTATLSLSTGGRGVLLAFEKLELTSLALQPLAYLSCGLCRQKKLASQYGL